MAMADLARNGAQAALPLSAIAERQQISLAYLEQLFIKLRRAELVESARGRSGGYRLARPAARISIAEIMAAVEEGVRMTRCGGEAAKPCLAGQRCLTHGLWDALGEQIAWFLDNVTVHDVVSGTAPAKIGRQVAADFPALPEMASAPSLLALLLRRDARPEGIDASPGPVPNVIGEQ